MSGSGSDDDGVRLYDALSRRLQQKRKMFVNLSSDSDDDSEEDEAERLPVRKRGKQSLSPASQKLRTPTKQPKEPVGVTESPMKDAFEALLTPEEREAERRRAEEMEREISRQLEKDSVIAQARQIMSKVTAYQVQATNEINLCSDSEEEEDGATPPLSEPAFQDVSPLEPEPVVVVPASSRGERLKLKVRSNGAAIDEIDMHMNDKFDMLFTNFCDIHGLPRSAVVMFLDGEELTASSTPAENDLETGDLIDAKVDFTKQVRANIKRYLRLRLVVFGRRSEVFKIDASSTVEKLHASYCKKHSIANPYDVTMSVNGEELNLAEHIEHYGLMDNDEVSVHINNYVDPGALPLKLRYDDGSPDTTEHVLANDNVEVLFRKVANLKQCGVSAIKLYIDGESMSSSQTFKHYDLEGDELIDVKIAR